MAQMSIEGRQQRRALLNDAYARVGVSMNAPFVSFGATKPALQVQVVARKIVGALHEQARCEALHDARHGGVEARGGSSETEGDLVEVVSTRCGRAGGRIEGAMDATEVGDVDRHFIELRLHRGDPLVDTAHELH